MSAEHPGIRRIDVGDGIYVRVPHAEATAAPSATDTDHASARATERAWSVRPAAVATAAGVAAAALVRLGVTAHGLLAAGLLVVLVGLASIDLQARVLPNRIVFPATGIVLGWQLAFFPGSAGEWLLAALGAGFFMLVPSLLRPGAMGMGDVKLAVLLGAALGRDVLSALTLGCLAVLPVALWLLVRGRRVRNATVPLGPFLAFGAAVVLLV
jgi:leader peptidase (prepilin peptidase) / N-methyltransferase